MILNRRLQDLLIDLRPVYVLENHWQDCTPEQQARLAEHEPGATAILHWRTCSPEIQRKLIELAPEAAAVYHYQHCTPEQQARLEVLAPSDIPQIYRQKPEKRKE